MAYLPNHPQQITFPVMLALLDEIWTTPTDILAEFNISYRTWCRWKASGVIPGPFKAMLHSRVLLKRAGLAYGNTVPIFGEPPMPPEMLGM